MATTLYLASPVKGISAGHVYYSLWSPLGGPKNKIVLRTTTSASDETTGIQVSTQDGSGLHIQAVHYSMPVEWVSAPLAAGATISGTISLHTSGVQTGMNANVQMAGEVYKLSNGTYTLIGSAQDGIEMALSQTSYDWDITPTSTTLAAGDRIVVRMFFDSFGTMNSGYQATLGLGFNDEATATFTETLSFASETFQSAQAFFWGYHLAAYDIANRGLKYLYESPTYNHHKAAGAAPNSGTKGFVLNGESSGGSITQYVSNINFSTYTRADGYRNIGYAITETYGLSADDRAIAVGGRYGGQPSNSINSISYASETVDSANYSLSVYLAGPQAVAAKNYGYVSGGISGSTSFSTVIEKIPLLTYGDGVSISETLSSTYAPSNNRGALTGTAAGYFTSSSPYTHLNKFVYATETSSVLTSALANGAQYASAVGDDSVGVLYGTYASSQYHAVEEFSFSSETAQTLNILAFYSYLTPGVANYSGISRRLLYPSLGYQTSTTADFTQNASGTAPPEAGTGYSNNTTQDVACAGIGGVLITSTSWANTATRSQSFIGNVEKYGTQSLTLASFTSSAVGWRNARIGAGANTTNQVSSSTGQSAGYGSGRGIHFVGLPFTTVSPIDKAQVYDQIGFISYDNEVYTIGSEKLAQACINHTATSSDNRSYVYAAGNTLINQLVFDYVFQTNVSSLIGAQASELHDIYTSYNKQFIGAKFELTDEGYFISSTTTFQKLIYATRTFSLIASQRDSNNPHSNCANSATTGYLFGGSTSSSTIDALTFATSTGYVVGASLGIQTRGGVNLQSDTVGYTAVTSNNTNLRAFTFSTETVSTSAFVFSGYSVEVASTTMPSKGFYMSLIDSFSIPYTSIRKFLFSSETISFASSTTNGYYGCGTQHVGIPTVLHFGQGSSVVDSFVSVGFGERYGRRAWQFLTLDAFVSEGVAVRKVTGTSNRTVAQTSDAFGTVTVRGTSSRTTTALTTSWGVTHANGQVLPYQYLYVDAFVAEAYGIIAATGTSNRTFTHTSNGEGETGPRTGVGANTVSNITQIGTNFAVRIGTSARTLTNFSQSAINKARNGTSGTFFKTVNSATGIVRNSAYFEPSVTNDVQQDGIGLTTVRTGEGASDISTSVDHIGFVYTNAVGANTLYVSTNWSLHIGDGTSETYAQAISLGFGNVNVVGVFAPITYLSTCAGSGVALVQGVASSLVNVQNAADGELFVRGSASIVSSASSVSAGVVSVSGLMSNSLDSLDNHVNGFVDIYGAAATALSNKTSSARGGLLIYGVSLTNVSSFDTYAAASSVDACVVAQLKDSVFARDELFDLHAVTTNTEIICTR